MQRLRITLIRIVLAAAALCVTAVGADAAQCSISTTSVAFGPYNVFNTAPNDSTGTIVYRCNGNANAVLITITSGNGGSFEPRQLSKGDENLSYNLYRDAARTTVWGDSSGGTSSSVGLDPPNNQNVSLTVYGRIPAGQDISAGSYSDTVTVVVNF